MALENERRDLTTGLEKTVAAYAKIDLREIAELERDTAKLIAMAPAAEIVLADQRRAALVHDFGIVAQHARTSPALVTLLRTQGTRPARLKELAHIGTVLESCKLTIADLGQVTSFSLKKLEALEAAIDEIEDMRMRVFGYMFAGKQLRQTTKTLRDKCKIVSEKPHRELSKLKEIRDGFTKLREHLVVGNIEGEFDTAVFLIKAELVGAGKSPIATQAVLESVRRLEEAVSLSLPLFASANGRFYTAMLEEQGGSLAVVCRLGELKVREAIIGARFAAVPKVNYIGAKAKIESLNTQHLAERIDERLIEFHDTKKSDAMALGKIIRESSGSRLIKFRTYSALSLASLRACAITRSLFRWNVRCSIW